MLLLTLAELAQATPAPAPSSGLPGNMPAWAYLMGLLITAVLAPLAVGYMGHLLRKGQRETREAVEQVQATAVDTSRRVRETERKLTSNHGRDTIGVKVDELKDDMGKVLSFLPQIVDAASRLGERVDDLEELTKATVGQVADNTVSAAVSFEELGHTLDSIAPPMDARGTRYCRRRHHSDEELGACPWQHQPTQDA